VKGVWVVAEGGSRRVVRWGAGEVVRARRQASGGAGRVAGGRQVVGCGVRVQCACECLPT